MNIREIDWRQSSLRQILSALSQGLDANAQAFDEGRDVDDAIEYEDDLCGIAFVTAQAYITRVVADVNHLRGTLSPIKKHDLLKTGNPIVADTRLTRMQLCDALANYYKHRDQWVGWTDPDARRTTALLRTAGFTEGDSHLCTAVATLLFGDIKVESLVRLADMLSSWRVAVLAETHEVHQAVSGRSRPQSVTLDRTVFRDHVPCSRPGNLSLSLGHQGACEVIHDH